jgi:hypothetical protein
MPRPNLQPTEEDRKMVRLMAACGVDQEQIAARIGIRSPKTLRKHYREELDRGALDANVRVSHSLLKMATSGNCPAATIFWLKARAGWKDQGGFEPTAGAPPSFIVARENTGPAV